MATTFQVAKNRAKSALAADITDVATSLTVTAGEGAKFPSTYPFPITIEDEILKCTNRVTDTLTVERAQEGTSAVAHVAGKAVHLRITAKFASDLHTAVNAIENKPVDTCACTRTTGFSVPDSAWTAIPWDNADAEEWDTNDIHSTTTNPSRLTVKTTGKYLIFGFASWVTNTTGLRQIGIRVNGTWKMEIYCGMDTAGNSRMTITGVFILAANDYVELFAYQTSGAALNIDTRTRLGILLLPN